MAKAYVDYILAPTLRREQIVRDAAREQAEKDKLEAVKGWASQPGNVRRALENLHAPKQSRVAHLGRNFVPLPGPRYLGSEEHFMNEPQILGDDLEPVNHLQL